MVLSMLDFFRGIKAYALTLTFSVQVKEEFQNDPEFLKTHSVVKEASAAA